MFDDDLLVAFINEFYGYGDYRAPIWFVGMEEGGGSSPDEIARRRETWRQRGGRELEDLADYHRALGITRHFDQRAPLQATWSKLIRVLLAIEGHEPTTEQVRAYQRERLGHIGGGTCLLELLPLPSPGADQWLHYPDHSRLPFLQDRATYVHQVRPRRVAHLRQRIAAYKPRAVVFYSLSYLPHWEEVVGVRFPAAEREGVRLMRQNEVLYVVMAHPAAQGITNAYFHTVGRLIASNVKGP